MTERQWWLIYAGGFCLMVIGISSDWAMRASITGLGGAVVGYAAGRLDEAFLRRLDEYTKGTS